MMILIDSLNCMIASTIRLLKLTLAVLVYALSTDSYRRYV